MLVQHEVKQEIGRLKAGLYSARLYVDGVKRTGMNLFVSPDNVAVLSTGKYTDDQGGINLIGEVRNDAGQPVKQVRVDIDFLEGDQVVKEDQIYTTMEIIMPKMTSGFSLALNDNELAKKSFTARVTSYSTQVGPVEKGLSLELKYGTNKENYGIIQGTVFNKSKMDRDAKQVKIVCAVYDHNGNVIDSIFGYTDPAIILAGKQANFSIATHNKVAEGFTASCNAESTDLVVVPEQVHVVPEFPAAMLAAAGSLAAAIFAASSRFDYHKLK